MDPIALLDEFIELNRVLGAVSKDDLVILLNNLDQRTHPEALQLMETWRKYDKIARGSAFDLCLDLRLLYMEESDDGSKNIQKEPLATVGTSGSPA